MRISSPYFPLATTEIEPRPRLTTRISKYGGNSTSGVNTLIARRLLTSFFGGVATLSKSFDSFPSASASSSADLQSCLTVQSR